MSYVTLRGSDAESSCASIAARGQSRLADGWTPRLFEFVGAKTRIPSAKCSKIVQYDPTVVSYTVCVHVTTDEEAQYTVCRYRATQDSG